MSGHMLGCHNPGGGGGDAWGVGELLASSWWRSGNAAKYPNSAQDSPITRMIWPHIPIASWLMSPAKTSCWDSLSFSQSPQYRYMHTPMHTLSHTVLRSHTHILELEERLYDETKG